VRVGFEPTEPAKVQRFSRPPDSTALAPHRHFQSSGFTGLNATFTALAATPYANFNIFSIIRRGSRSGSRSTRLSLLKIMVSREAAE
jgi:hypothetical protein